MTLEIPVHPSGQGRHQPIRNDWFGQPARHHASFQLSLNQGQLIYRFRAEKAPECDLSHSVGDFVEGLWERDVAELFVMGPNGHYQEFNVSPCGAWWSAVFSGYRRRSAVLPCPSVRVLAQWNDRSWSVELSVALQDLPVLQDHSLKEARLNVTAILAPESPEYLCFGHAGGGEPDFHLAQNFLPVVLL